jgi:hypothetical protein
MRRKFFELKLRRKRIYSEMLRHLMWRKKKVKI